MKEHNGLESDQLALLNIIISMLNLHNKPDHLQWGLFSKELKRKDFYKSLLTHSGYRGLWKCIWKQKVPAKVRLFLWQLLHKTLPTNEFLHRRNIVQDPRCSLCGAPSENTAHIFWECSLARDGWSILGDWLSIDFSQLDVFEMELIFKITKPKGLHFTGSVCLIATLWSIWISRNIFVFKQQRVSRGNLDHMIKQNSFTWGLSFKLVSRNHVNIWCIDPNLVISNYTKKAKRRLLQYWLETADLVGFIDGAWSKVAGSISAGIGELLVHKYLSTRFIFLGPVIANTPYDAEVEALCFLLGQLSESLYKSVQVVVLSDSALLVKNLNKFRT